MEKMTLTLLLFFLIILLNISILDEYLPDYYQYYENFEFIVNSNKLSENFLYDLIIKNIENISHNYEYKRIIINIVTAFIYCIGLYFIIREKLKRNIGKIAVLLLSLILALEYFTVRLRAGIVIALLILAYSQIKNLKTIFNIALAIIVVLLCYKIHPETTLILLFLFIALENNSEYSNLILILSGVFLNIVILMMYEIRGELLYSGLNILRIFAFIPVIFISYIIRNRLSRNVKRVILLCGSYYLVGLSLYLFGLYGQAGEAFARVGSILLVAVLYATFKVENKYDSLLLIALGLINMLLFLRVFGFGI